MSYDVKDIRSWKKVYECDLENIIIELKEATQDPCVIILNGVVGAGKTTFTKIFLSEQTQSTSPTYSIINEAGNSVHADFYRLESREEMIHLEIPLYLEGKQYFLVEWGKDYVLDIYREVDETFKFYELDIKVNEKKEVEEFASRDFSLKSIHF